MVKAVSKQESQEDGAEAAVVKAAGEASIPGGWRGGGRGEGC